jgi:mannitol-specific phosphotransferase system IIBC component
MAPKNNNINVDLIPEKGVTLKVKTIAWIVGVLISAISTLATMGYLNMKADIKNQKDIFEEEKRQYKDEIRDMIQKELREESNKRELMIKDIGDIKGDIKVILDRTGGGTSNHVNENKNIPVTTPESIPLPK